MSRADHSLRSPARHRDHQCAGVARDEAGAAWVSPSIWPSHERVPSGIDEQHVAVREHRERRPQRGAVRRCRGPPGTRGSCGRASRAAGAEELALGHVVDVATRDEDAGQRRLHRADVVADDEDCAPARDALHAVDAQTPPEHDPRQQTHAERGARRRSLGRCRHRRPELERGFGRPRRCRAHRCRGVRVVRGTHRALRPAKRRAGRARPPRRASARCPRRRPWPELRRAALRAHFLGRVRDTASAAHAGRPRCRSRGRPRRLR